MPRDTTSIRRINANSLFQQFAESQIAMGVDPKGLGIAFAAKLAISQSMWSQIKKSRPISDKLARQIESCNDLPKGWLDTDREPQGMTQAEIAFVASAIKAWRTTDSAGRKRLKKLLTTNASAMGPVSCQNKCCAQHLPTLDSKMAPFSSHTPPIG